MNPTIIFKKLHPDAKIPRYQSAQASGMDLHALEGATIRPHGLGAFATGLSIEIPPGFEAQIRPRSGLATKFVLAALGTIDSDYRGQLWIILYNHGGMEWHIEAGQRIAQLVIAPVARCEIREGELSETTRGTGGLGSTGR